MMHVTWHLAWCMVTVQQMLVIVVIFQMGSLKPRLRLLFLLSVRSSLLSLVVSLLHIAKF